MLVIERSVGESLVIGGGIRVVVDAVIAGRVQLVIDDRDLPQRVHIDRGEQHVRRKAARRDIAKALS